VRQPLPFRISDDLSTNRSGILNNGDVDTRRLQLLLSGLKVRGEISREMATNGESPRK
jgi:hypothetical protein